jgi:hypothetical protein
MLFASAGIILFYQNCGKKVKLLIAAGIIITFVILTGNRITILPLLVSLIIPTIYDTKHKLTLKKILLFSFLGFSAIYIVYILRLLRIYGGFYSFINSFNLVQVNTQVMDMILNGNGELGLRKAFYYFISIDNRFPGFNKAHTYIRLLLIALPTSLSFGIKPPDFAITMGSAWLNDPYNTTYSMHPTLYGDIFANLWWFGIFLGIFWAIFTYIIDIFVNRRNIVINNILLVLFGTVYIIVGRGSVYNGFFIGYSGSIIIGIMYLISRFKVRL